MAQAVSRRPLTAAAWVRAQVNPVGFVVDKVALGEVFSEFFGFPCQHHSAMGSTFPIIKKIVLSFIPLHSSSSGDGQKARKSNHNTRTEVAYWNLARARYRQGSLPAFLARKYAVVALCCIY
jgi:hypothetical protein